MDVMRAAPSGSNLPTFFRWCLGGMAAFASGPGSGAASAPDAAAAAAAAERVLRLGKEVEVECGDISASQEDLLARAPFLGGGGGEEEAEVFSTPPLTQGQQGQQSQQGQGVQEEEEDAITMCSLPFTQLSPSVPSSEDKEDQALAVSKPRKPRVCTRKVRGARIRTPTPSPNQSPDNRSTSTNTSSIVDPLYRAVLMIPTNPAPPTAAEDLLALARNRGIF
ncbi:hypothetical protein SEVIR_2G198500v4 [Setaria viridis]|uniref:Uncharacterized protein n=2 Tax=Setaria viridis TaxID=4556 RepID=A0A4U6VVT4_SETVI|nr:uncharacterized protein LOC117843911 [Setaria viridis]TKW32922.1 hypothetical protein SEVIR_2G198500v2 [Setaria viridis]TKW32923.1 hypothetical protein SEVIR_2G198500v2 [Setaria viridis]TKW32924.1 hypothetical protein SEVIR_2G198500v2 [Setaria viridis]TKW32925.1 hypothetical protein SEVIR_2G198500v2 [Setaria viridis]TKW32926.1 hypothetical protein SEVIR_2G198500v2 [Setaria viridis]